MRAFAAKRDLAETNLAKWKQRYADPSQAKAAFVEVAPMTMADQPADFHYELKLARGHTLRFRRGFEAGEVEKLVAALTR